MIKQMNSEEIRRINNRNDERELAVLNWLKTVCGIAGIGFFILACWALTWGK